MLPGKNERDKRESEKYRNRPNCIEDYDMGRNNERQPRAFEHWKDDYFLNKNGLRVQSVPFTGASTMSEYPGNGGMVMGGVRTKDAASGVSYETGIWPSYNYYQYYADNKDSSNYSAWVNKTGFYRQVAEIESNGWYWLRAILVDFAPTHESHFARFLLALTITAGTTGSRSLTLITEGSSTFASGYHLVRNKGVCVLPLSNPI